MKFVFLALEIFEEPADSGKLFLSIDNQPLVFRIHFRPWHIHRYARASGEPLHLCAIRPVLRFCPWFNRTIFEGFGFVRNYQIQVEVNGVTESLASRTRAERVIERKQSWFRLHIPNTTTFALEALRKPKLLHRLIVAANRLKKHFATLAKADLGGVDDARPCIR